MGGGRARAVRCREPPASAVSALALLLDLLLVCSWGEDWIFELPVASPQMTAIELKAFQAGMRRYPQDPNSTEPSPPIHMYIMVLHKRLSLTVTSVVGLSNKMSFRTS